jgi:hypothetical protein
LWPGAPGRSFDRPLQTKYLPNQTFVFETSTIGLRIDAINAVMEGFASATRGFRPDIANRLQQRL